MHHLLMIQQFLQTRRSLKDVPDSGYPFVTISRQAGAGGRMLAYVLLTDFLKQSNTGLFQGWHVFDREVFDALVTDPALQEALEQLVSEPSHSEFQQFLDSLFVGRSEKYVTQKKTFKIVRLLAALGKVILVGRAGACVTREMPAGVHVRLVAPAPRRTIWMMERFNLAHAEARDTIARQDAERAKLLKTFFGQDIDDPLLYDAVWNTERTDLHQISESIIQMIEHRAPARKKHSALV